MHIAFKCSECGTDLITEGENAGGKIPCENCNAEQNVPPFTLGPGLVIGGFLLQKHLGNGSMGDVFLATQLSMERKVAIKTLPATVAANPEAIDRFLHEVQITAHLDHPNIVTAFDAGEDEGIYYMAMSYVDGTDFKNMVEEQAPLPEREACQVIRCVAGALNYAWSEYQILHRDIKPENIMLDRYGNVKLMDMGISKSLNEDGGVTMAGLVVGTPHYMSPEQAWSDDPIDFRADIYSLGATLYFLLSGQPPYTGSAQAVFKMLHAPDPIVPLKQLAPNISPEVAALVDVMLAPDPDARHPSWTALIEDIDRALGNEMPLHTLPDAAPSRLTKESPDSGTNILPGVAAISLGSSLEEIDNALAPQPKLEPKKDENENTLTGTDEPSAVPDLAIVSEPPPPDDFLGNDDEKLVIQPKKRETPLSLQLKPHGAKKEKPPASAPAPPTEDSVADAPPMPDESVDEEANAIATEEELENKAITILHKVGRAILILLVIAAISGFIWLFILPAPKHAKGKTRRPTPTRVVSAPRPTPRPKPKPKPKTKTAPKPKPNPKPAGPSYRLPTAAELASIKKQIAAKLQKEIPALQINEQPLARAARLGWPVTPPTKTPEEIKKLVEDVARKKAQKHLRARNYKAIAEEKYSPYAVGDIVNFFLKTHVGARATGKLTEVGPDYVIVNDRKIPFTALSSTDRIRLNPQKAKEKIAMVATAWQKQHDAQVEKETRKLVAHYEPEAFKKFGYIKQNGQWTPKTKILAAAVEKEKKIQVMVLATRIEEKVFKKNGFRKVGGKWVK